MRSFMFSFLFACAGGAPSDLPLDASSLPDSTAPDAAAPDRFERNDDVDHATDLGDFDDALDPKIRVDQLTIDPGDQDWFRFHVTDGLDFGNPWIVVAVPPPHELRAAFACDTSDIGTLVAGDKTWVVIHPQCSGLVDNGTVTLRVTDNGAYDLFIGVE